MSPDLDDAPVLLLGTDVVPEKRWSGIGPCSDVIDQVPFVAVHDRVHGNCLILQRTMVSNGTNNAQLNNDNNNNQGPLGDIPSWPCTGSRAGDDWLPARGHA